MAQNKNMEQGISLIICCYNSSQRLPRTLHYLALQENLANVPYELIIVNNASIDNTSDIALEEWSKNGAPYPLKIVIEEQPGLSFAREKGISEAQYEYIIFCDDDNWLSPTYLKYTYEIMSTNASIGILGGRAEATSEGEFPCWFTTYQGNYAVGVLGLRSGDVSARGDIWGAGMVFRKSEYRLLRNLGFSNILSDRKGNALSGGGDTEICKWFLLLGKKLWYDERLSFKHYIEPRRLELSYIENLRKENEKYAYLIKKYDMVIALNPTPKFKEIFIFSKHLIRYAINIALRRQQHNTSILLELHNPFSFITFDPEIKKMKMLKTKIKQYNF